MEPVQTFILASQKGNSGEMSDLIFVVLSANLVLEGTWRELCRTHHKLPKARVKLTFRAQISPQSIQLTVMDS